MTELQQTPIKQRHEPNVKPKRVPLCVSCKNYISPRVCQAFPSIPLEIWENRFRHTEPYPGDNGKRFTPKFG